MSHLDDDTLTVLALGEDIEQAAPHLVGCDRCRHELSALQRVVSAGRAVDPAMPIPAPPPELWAGIAAQLGLADAPAQPPAPARPRRPLALAAAACLAILAVVAAVTLTRGPDVVAETALEPVGGSGVRGTATLVDEGGGLALRLDVADLPAADGYYELWLLDDSGQRLVSLGPLQGGETHRLPPGLEPTDFPVVDVSAEPLDGDPTHSGRSLARGTLPI